MDKCEHLIRVTVEHFHDGFMRTSRTRSFNTTEEDALVGICQFPVMLSIDAVCQAMFQLFDRTWETRGFNKHQEEIVDAAIKYIESFHNVGSQHWNSMLCALKRSVEQIRDGSYFKDEDEEQDG